MFYKHCLDYLEIWSVKLVEIDCFEWTELKNVVHWEEVQGSLLFIRDRFSHDKEIIDENALLDQITYLKEYVSEQRLLSWKNENKPVDLKWVEVFNFFEKENVLFDTLKK